MPACCIDGFGEPLSRNDGLMASLGEIIRALYGSWRFLRLDSGGLAYFDGSVAGAWRSFTVALLLLPFHVAVLGMRLAKLDPSTTAVAYWLVESLTYVVSWLAFPVAAAVVIERLGLMDRFPVYLTVYNWVSGFVNMPLIALQFGSLAGVLPLEVTGFLSLILFCVVCLCLWFVARTVLAIPGLAAAGLVALDLAITYLVFVLAQRLY